jgi:hypothetical protein
MLHRWGGARIRQGSGSQAEWDADKQRFLLLIYWSKSAPRVETFGADLRLGFV